ncbi:MAG TPA: type II toxin-antitoxin system VapC family toxin [Gammaproteobacteria bacterium]|nr:type II toxin-antitoxin system VapC family toxin [Gammaproteobacteria bacterium]
MTLRYLLDTNICIYIAKQHPEKVLKKFNHLMVGEVGMSIITYGELHFGACKSQYTQKSLSILNELVNLIPILPMFIHVGDFYGKIRSTLETQGKPIGNNDLWIAAHALSLNITLVSNNLKEFSRVPTLKLENWVA